MSARLRTYTTLSLLSLAAASASATVMTNSIGPITFAGGSDLSSNFRQVPGPFGSTVANTLSQGSDANYACAGLDGADGSSASNVAIAFYDPLNTSTTPATLSNANQFNGPVTVSFNTRSNVANDSIGVFFTDPNSESGTGSILALVNWNYSGSGSSGAGTADKVRIWTGCNADTNTLGTLKYTYTSSDIGLDISEDPSDPLNWKSMGATNILEPLTYAPLSVEYAVSGTDALITLVGPNATLGPIDLGAGTALANAPEIGLRVGPTVTGFDRVDFTNFSISIPSVPEPASAGLLMGAAALMLRRRRA